MVKVHLSPSVHPFRSLWPTWTLPTEPRLQSCVFMFWKRCSLLLCHVSPVHHHRHEKGKENPHYLTAIWTWKECGRTYNKLTLGCDFPKQPKQMPCGMQPRPVVLLALLTLARSQWLRKTFTHWVLLFVISSLRMSHSEVKMDVIK